MTKLLVLLNDVEDARTAFDVRADIVMCGAISRQTQKICSQIKGIDSYSPEIWFEVDDVSTIDVNCLRACGADAIVISSTVEHLSSFVKAMTDQAREYKLVVMVEAEISPNNSLIPVISAFGFDGILLKASNVDQTILSQLEIAKIGQFIAKAHAAGLQAGVIGTIEAPDIPRLLPYSPDWLGFLVKRPIKSGQFGDRATSSLMRALLPRDSGREILPEGNELGTDRIIVENYILPVEIGAYKREYGHKQQVRFNVSADVSRLSANPEDMRHIFSYDLILDGIRNLVALGHVDLVETLAERVAALILAYPRVEKVVVRVDKLELGPAAVGVEIERIKKKNGR